MNNNQKLSQLITPSWLVNFIGLTVGLLATGAVIVLAQFQGSELRRQIFEVQSSGKVGTQADALTTNIADNNFLNSLPLLLTWAAVGLVVYYFAVAIGRSFGQAAELKEELEYVNMSRQSRIRQAVIHLAVRAAAVAGWFIFIKVTLSLCIPYALAAANAASTELSLENVGYALVSIVTIYLTICVHAVFLRLIALKPRLFGN